MRILNDWESMLDNETIYIRVNILGFSYILHLSSVMFHGFRVVFIIFSIFFPFSSNDIGFGLQVQQFWSHAHHNYAKMLLTSLSPQYATTVVMMKIVMISLWLANVRIRLKMRIYMSTPLLVISAPSIDVEITPALKIHGFWILLDAFICVEI